MLRPVSPSFGARCKAGEGERGGGGDALWLRPCVPCVYYSRSTNASSSRSRGGVDVAQALWSRYSNGGRCLAPAASTCSLSSLTFRAELGRATWRFLHTMTLRFPESPTPAERQALADFMHLFARLYPCGECAAHFQALLVELPPQTSSRKTASLWLCTAHNRVNRRLGKEEFPCDKVRVSSCARGGGGGWRGPCYTN
jgi:hypothetical protein